MKILVPIDGSRHSLEGLKVASHYATTKAAETTLLTVIPAVADIDLELSASERDRVLESMKRRGEEVLTRAREALGRAGVAKVSTVLSTADSPAQEIVAIAEKEKVDLIIIGSKGRNATTRFILGSTAARVVRHSPCCVHVVKEPCWS